MYHPTTKQRQSANNRYQAKTNIPQGYTGPLPPALKQHLATVAQAHNPQTRAAISYVSQSPAITKAAQKPPTGQEILNPPFMQNVEKQDEAGENPSESIDVDSELRADAKSCNASTHDGEEVTVPAYIDAPKLLTSPFRGKSCCEAESTIWNRATAQTSSGGSQAAGGGPSAGGRGSEEPSDIQLSALEHLLSGKTVQATADLIGVNERTIRRWQQQPEFIAEYKSIKRSNFEAITERLRKMAEKAADNMERLMNSENESIKLRANRAVLQLAKETAANLKLEAQLEELETLKAYLTEDFENTKAEHEATVETFKKDSANILTYAKELDKMRAALIAGTFRRTSWIPKESWEQIIQANYHAPAISRS